MLASLAVILKSTAGICASATALVGLVVATYRKVTYERATEKAIHEDDTSDLDHALGE